MELTSLGIPIPDAPAQVGSALLPQIALAIKAVNSLLEVPSLAADVANSTNVLAALNGLSRDVVSGKIYNFKIVLWVAASEGEGLQIDLHGGTAAMTWFRAMYVGYDGSSQALISAVTALATAVGPETAFSGMIQIEGSFKPSGDGTFAPRIAQTAHSTGSVTVLKGSNISVEVAP